MIRNIILLIVLCAITTYVQSAVWYWGSGEAVNLENSIGFQNHSQKIITGDADDPSVVAKSAAQGSLYLRSGGGVYFKTDAGSSTNWSLIPGSFSVSAPLTYALGTLGITKADATHDGYLSQGDWGTFNGKQNALTFGSISTSTTGVTVGSGSNSTVGPNVTVDVQTASALQPGLLSAADWSTFNGKEPAQTKGSISTSTTGVTIGSGSNSTVGPNVTVDIATASGTTTGLLTSGDWTTFSNGASKWTLNGSDIYRSSNVGIGITNPAHALSVVGTTNLNGDTTATQITTTGNVGIGITNPVHPLSVVGNSYFNGNVGVGNASPAYKLDVTGAFNTDTNIRTPLLSFFSNSRTTAFEGSGAASADVTYTLPPADGAASAALVTNGSGTLSWSNTFPVPLGGVFFGSIKYNPIANCAWTHTTVNTWTGFAADNDCNNPITEKNIIAPSAKIPAVRASSWPAGRYVFVINGIMGNQVSQVYAGLGLRLSDGVNTTSVASDYNQQTDSGASTTYSYGSGYSVAMTLNNSLGDTTFNLQSYMTIGEAQVYANNANYPFEISVYYYPNITATAITGGGQVRSWSGIHSSADCLWNTSSTSYVIDTGDSSCTFTEKANRNFYTVSSTTDGSGKTPGLKFTPTETGTLHLCATAGYLTVDTAGRYARIELYDGTSLTETSEIYSDGLVVSGQSLCTVSSITNLSEKSYNIRHKMAGGSGVSYLGQLTWTMIFIPDVIMPAIAGAVVTNGASQTRTEYAYISGNGSIAFQSGSWLSSITHTGGTGTYALNFSSNMFSSTPVCVGNTNANITVYSQSDSSTGITFATSDNLEHPLKISCSGPRGSAN